MRRLIDAPDYVCDGLVANALVVPEGDDFLFAHALIQEGAYSTLLRARRRELHRRAADWFAATDPVLHAQHLDRADDDARAAAPIFDAALAQRTAYFTEAALRLIERGLEIAKKRARRSPRAHLSQGRTATDLGDIAASIDTYRADWPLRPTKQVYAARNSGSRRACGSTRDLPKPWRCSTRPSRWRNSDDMVAELARLHHLRGNILFPLGRIDGLPRPSTSAALLMRGASASPEAEARALGGLADAAYAQGRMRTAFEHFSRCVDLSREHGLGRIEVANRSMVGFSRMYLNEARQAREDADGGDARRHARRPAARADAG